MMIVIFLSILFAGMAVISVLLLQRYATYGREASVKMAEGTSAGNEDAKKGGQEEKVEEERAVLLKKLEPGLLIRVRILADSYQEEYHEKIAVTAEDDVVVNLEDGRQVIPAGEILSVRPEKGEGAGEENAKTEEQEEKPQEDQTVHEIVLAPGQMLTVATAKGGPLILPELKREQERPAYEGKLYVYGSEEGLGMVNEVGLEEYLCSVVSSEMPSSYPLQALCAQAVCARTYAVNCMENARKQDLEADLADSASSQVYNNYPGDETSRQAVKKTEGVVMDKREALYYSTSCLTEEREDLAREEDFRTFLDAPPEQGAEYGSPWLRWSVEIPAEDVLGKIREKYHCSWEKLERAEVAERNPQGQVQRMVFSDGNEEIMVDGEYQVRDVLTCSGTQVRLMDGSEVGGLTLLPSAYFYLEDVKSGEAGQETESGQTPEELTEIAETDIGTTQEGEGTSFKLRIFGGGYGHGIGMSQNGAAAMAQEGSGYEEILDRYYAGD